jgi:hypothetical protein
MFEPIVSAGCMPGGQQPGRFGQDLWRVVAVAYAAGAVDLMALPRRGSYDFLPVRAAAVAGLAPTSQGSLQPPAAQHLSTPIGLDGRHG